VTQIIPELPLRNIKQRGRAEAKKIEDAEMGFWTRSLLVVKR
jgi:hypothetical protein